MELSEISALIQSYIDGQSYQSFRERFVDVYAQLSDSEDSPALALCRAVEWEIAELSEQNIDDRQLRENLAAVLAGQSSREIELSFSSSRDVLPPKTVTSTSSPNVSGWVLALGQQFDVGFSAEYASEGDPRKIHRSSTDPHLAQLGQVGR